MSDAELFRSLNAGLRVQVSDLTGHANVLTAKVAALEAEVVRLREALVTETLTRTHQLKLSIP